MQWVAAQTPNSQRLGKRDPEEKPRSLYPFRFALDPAGVPGLGASPGVLGKTALCDEHKQMPASCLMRLAGINDWICVSANTEKSLVARDGIEPPTRGFSIRCSTN